MEQSIDQGNIIVIALIGLLLFMLLKNKGGMCSLFGRNKETFVISGEEDNITCPFKNWDKVGSTGSPTREPWPGNASDALNTDKNCPADAWQCRGAGHGTTYFAPNNKSWGDLNDGEKAAMKLLWCTDDDCSDQWDSGFYGGLKGCICPKYTKPGAPDPILAKRAQKRCITSMTNKQGIVDRDEALKGEDMVNACPVGVWITPEGVCDPDESDNLYCRILPNSRPDAFKCLSSKSLAASPSETNPCTYHADLWGFKCHSPHYTAMTDCSNFTCPVGSKSKSLQGECGDIGCLYGDCCEPDSSTSQSNAKSSAEHGVDKGGTCNADTECKKGFTCDSDSKKCKSSSHVLLWVGGGLGVAVVVGLIVLFATRKSKDSSTNSSDDG